MMQMDFTLSLGKTGNKLHKIQNILSVLLLLGDIFGLIFSLGLAFWLNAGQNSLGNTNDPVVYIFSLLVLTGLYLGDTYHPDNQISGFRSPYRAFISCAIVGIVSLIIGFCLQSSLFYREVLPPSLSIFTIWSVGSRLWAARWVRSHAQETRWLVLGAGKKSIQFIETFLERCTWGRLTVLAESNQDIDKLPKNSRVYISNLSDLPQWSQQSWSGVVVANSIELSDAEVQQLIQLRLSGTSIYTTPDVCEALWYKIPSSLLQDSWLAFGSGFNLSSGSISQKLKRVIDIALTWILLVCLSPLMLVTALAIKLNSPGPVFYSQMRTGLEGKPFKVYKFRSMYQDAEKRGVQWANERDPRITSVGRWIRLTRVDELPQILNVLRGEMSLIGPRPERPEFDVKLRQEIPYYDLRYVVKPGITGWAQVMYPYGASVEDAYQKLSYDLYYIKNYSLWLDLAIGNFKIRSVVQ
ncbi:sugar transferase [Cronbergia sp. UHCC 0137]|uniref:sugar transferase n=1 Tax=Cronbergia sp. UHCC 0137 TaxID=3110239 RepID=UPI002B1F40A7|nr:sugar transferase [Cronbergia sp. UHCC 0137]MEA5618343.1 sugar transferase [Cronbergia sp. UHCC 0137]